tara:strand:- start:603 stop:1004 length:402 start_codon:yes stop_codon:yes gene_type:complete
VICLDTTFLIETWRNRRNPAHPVHQFALANDGEDLVVPVPAAGEFLEGSAYVSQDRLKESMQFIQGYHIGELNFETAVFFAGIVAQLRHDNLMKGPSDFDLWIAAYAVQHGARLATRNVKHFETVPGLRLAAY